MKSFPQLISLCKHQHKSFSYAKETTLKETLTVLFQVRSLTAETVCDGYKKKMTCTSEIRSKCHYSGKILLMTRICFYCCFCLFVSFTDSLYLAEVSLLHLLISSVSDIWRLSAMPQGLKDTHVFVFVSRGVFSFCASFSFAAFFCGISSIYGVCVAKRKALSDL